MRNLFQASGESSEVSGIGGTGIAYGKITGFGSVFVNGREFNTDTSNFLVDGAIADLDALRLGMVITLKAETSNGVFTGKAFDVIYDDELEGPVAVGSIQTIGATRKSFIVFGKTIVIDETSTQFEGSSFAGLLEDDLVEISGFHVTDNLIRATYVRKTGVLDLGTSEVELRGLVKNLGAGGQGFQIDGVSISLDGNTEIDFVLEEDLLVEVRGIINSATAVYAERIEIEDEVFGSNVNGVSLQGVISGFTGNLSSFLVNGQQVNASQASLFPANAVNLLVDGLNVEVEGDIVNNVLIAEELEIREGEAKLRSYVFDKSGDQFRLRFPPPLGMVTIKVNTQTLFKDEAGASPNPAFSLADLASDDFVRVEGIEINDIVTASIVKRRDAGNIEIEGEVDAYSAGSSIVIFGLVYGLSGSTTYSPSSPDIDIGDIVEIEDDIPFLGDGIADQVEED